ncbi:MAG: DUF192 domain-containing protein [Brevefilum sp.]
MKIVNLRNASSDSPSFHVKYCDTFFSKLIGLMFSNELEPDHGLILVEKKESKANTAIHMLFVNYDITALWLDRNLVVVDKALAKRWRPAYVPKIPAQYVVELHRDHYPSFNIGDQLILSD